MTDTVKPRPMARVYRVGSIRFDGRSQELTVAGQVRPLEAKPLAVLQALLNRAGERVGKRDLMQAVWGNADHVSETSLTTAVSKLRTALGEAGRDLIDVVPGSGYRIAATVEVSVGRRPAALALALRSGDAVPGRPQWRLHSLLGAAALNDVWLARHDKTDEARVFKFADSADRLETLRREVALSRALHAALGARDDLVRIAEWNFDERPYFMEMPYGGVSLPAWAASLGGLRAVGLDTRLDILARVARTVAAAHATGVLHGDIKPANLLIDESAGGPAQPRLVDFGAGGLNDPGRLAALAVSLAGVAELTQARASGTLRYMAPEVLAGSVPTTAADIYALGILLYQVAAGDLDRPLALGWEADISDALLREDIAAAASGDPARRINSALDLADRLEALPSRRAARQAEADAAARAAALARQLEQARLRRPWVMLAAAALLAGSAIATLFGLRAVHDRNEAQRREAVVQAVNGFLSEDLLGRGNPANSGTANETLMDAAQAAEAGIDRRLADDPMVAGTIYLSLARAFDSRSTYGPARSAYDRAIAAFGRAGKVGRTDALIAQLHEAIMEVTSGEPGSMDRAQKLVAQTRPVIPALGTRRKEAQVWLQAATAMLQMLGGDVRAAQQQYRRAADGAEAMPQVFDASARLSLRQREAFTYLRLGEFEPARLLFETLLQQRLALNGPRHPDTLQTELNLAQTRIAQGHAAGALPELDRIYPDFVAVFGADHVRTLQLLATRAQALMLLGRYAEAITDDLTIHRLGAATMGERSYIALGSLADAAVTRCRAGQIGQGTDQARIAYGLVSKSFGASATLAQVTAGDLAFCLVRGGNDMAALDRLGGIDARAVAELTMDPQMAAELQVIRAAALIGLGQNSQAGPLLSQATPVLEQPGADPFMQRWERRLRAGTGGPSASAKDLGAVASSPP